MSSDVKFCDRVKFYCSCKFLFGTNHAIVLPDEDPAFENRLVIVPFARSVPLEQRDFSLAKKLEQERSAIIVRALWAYKGLRENRYHYAGDFRPNAVLGSGQGFYIDKIAAFLNSFCEYEEGAWTATQTLFARFTETNGVSCPDKAFSRVFLQLCDAQGLPVERCRGRLAPSLNPIWGFRGIKLKNEV